MQLCSTNFPIHSVEYYFFVFIKYLIALSLGTYGIYSINPQLSSFIKIIWMNLTIAKGTTGNLTLVANWSLTDYTVTLDPNGGSVSQTSFIARYTESYTLPEPTRTGYTFAGWYSGSTLYSGGTWTTFSNVTLTAQWTANEYTLTYDGVKEVKSSATVTFNYNYSGTTSYTVTLKDDDAVSYPTAPTRSGYVFTGWYTDSDCTTRYDFTGTITEDMTLYAGWQSINSYCYVLDPTNYNSSSYSYSIYNSSKKYNIPRNKSVSIYARRRWRKL